MFERFDYGARQAVVLAQEAARERHDRAIGLQHLLLGCFLAREPSPYHGKQLTDAGRVLRQAGLKERSLREAMREAGLGMPVHVGGPQPDPQESPTPIPFTDDAKQALELALREALSLGSNTIRAGHLLLALLRFPETGVVFARHVRALLFDKWIKEGS